MELPLYDMSTGHRCSCEQMSLAEMLEVQDHPVSEEQAWALCYQLCCILSHQLGEQTRKTAVSPAAEAVLFSRDGGVSLRRINGESGSVTLRALLKCVFRSIFNILTVKLFRNYVYI